jgi:hypothetical protein
VVQGRLADAEVLGDGFERGGVVAVLAECPQRRVEDLGTAPLPLAADVGGERGRFWAVGQGCRPNLNVYSNFERVVGLCQGRM